MTTLKPKPWDATALWIAIGFGAVAVVWTAVHAVQRIAQIVPNRDVPFTASFADTPVTLPFGVGGAEVPATVERVVLQVSDLPAITLVALIIAEIIYALAVIITVACVCLVIRNLIIGKAFDRSTIRLVGIATLTVAFGWVLTWLFTTMGANGGTAALSGRTIDNTNAGFDPLLLFGIASLGALTVAFQAGGRLQRDTEGLV